jgi:hypothetical protein
MQGQEQLTWNLGAGQGLHSPWDAFVQVRKRLVLLTHAQSQGLMA